MCDSCRQPLCPWVHPTLLNIKLQIISSDEALINISWIESHSLMLTLKATANFKEDGATYPIRKLRWSKPPANPTTGFIFKHQRLTCNCRRIDDIGGHHGDNLPQSRVSAKTRQMRFVLFMSSGYSTCYG